MSISYHLSSNVATLPCEK